jgi:hypothetical protein
MSDQPEADVIAVIGAESVNLRGLVRSQCLCWAMACGSGLRSAEC